MKAVTETLIETLESAITDLNEMVNENENGCGYVIEAKDHIRVNKPGINGTFFQVKCALTACDARVFSTQAEAEEWLDYWLVDGANKPIMVHTTNAHDFYANEIKKAKELLAIIKAKKSV